MVDEKLVFEDLKISSELKDKCKKLFFDNEVSERGTNYAANEIAPLLPRSIDIFPESLLKHMEEIGFGSDPFFITLLTYLNTYYMAESFAKRMKTVGRVGLGLEIMNAHKYCKRCSELDGKKFAWSELDKIPSLPLHWGCSCTIRVYFK